MKSPIRTLSLLVVLALVGATSSSALLGYHPGDCAYECWNPTTSETIQAKTQASPAACCSGTATFSCPVGWTYLDTLFYVDSRGPQVCE